jgi:hypothetical protein
MGVFAAVLVATCLALPLEAFAGAPTTAIEPPSTCGDYVGLTHHIAGCIRDTIDQGAGRFFDEFYPYLKDTISAVITLAIVIYGVMLSVGLVEKIGRDSVVLLIKIAVISALVTSSPMMFSTVIGAMDGAAAAVVDYAPASGTIGSTGADYSQSTCMQVMVSEQATADRSKPIITPWLGIDCLIDSIIGIKIESATGTGSQKWFNDTLESTDPSKPHEGVARGLLYFFFSGLQTSVLGALLALVGGFFIYGILMLIVRAFFSYIAGYLGVTLLIIVSPLFLPLILFRETKQYFDKWAKMLIGFALQPIIMLVFIIFSLTAVDFAAFSGDYSIMYTIAGDASRTAPFSLNDYLTTQRDKNGNLDTSSPPCADCGGIIMKTEKPLAGIKTASPQGDVKTQTPIDSRDTGGVVDNLSYSACSTEKITADEAKSGTTHALKKFCDAQYNVRMGINKIDWDKLAAAHQPAITIPSSSPTGTTVGQVIARQVLASVAFCTMVVFVLNGMLAFVPAIVLDLLGDFGQSADLNSMFKNNLGGGATGGMSSLASKFTAPFTKPKS